MCHVSVVLIVEEFTGSSYFRSRPHNALSLWTQQTVAGALEWLGIRQLRFLQGSQSLPPCQKYGIYAMSLLSGRFLGVGGFQVNPLNRYTKSFWQLRRICGIFVPSKYGIIDS